MRFISVLVVVGFLGCSDRRPQVPAARLFADQTVESGINFRNDLSYTENFNPYTYRNFYNGAGVAIGDINNDGLQDVYFAGNLVDNKLFLNEGNFAFKDITTTAGVACAGVWSTGVTFVDINADGFLDIYVCKSGNPDAARRHNELFINNGDLTFTERSKEYGLDVTGLSVQAAFFDFDKDGDLDCYLLTNSFKSIGQYDLVKNQREIPDPTGGGNKFFINENGKFRDYSREAGIYRSNIGFGLGITLGDFNHDEWTDIFVSNDFFERDYLYLNDQNGGFQESLTDYFESISMGSMGADFADLDNDGKPELFVTEMLPDSLARKKTKTVYESWDKYQLNIQNGYYHQVSRNVLQKMIGDRTYVEVGRMAGVEASEWSWGALLFDMDNDGLRDIFIANGIFKDLLDRDYLTYTAADDNVRRIIREEEHAIMKLIELMPSSEFPNCAFRNEGALRFRNVAGEWGLGEPMFSSGSAYGDLDNDGDLDLVVSNLNAAAKVYRNNTDSSTNKSLTVAVSASGKNTFAVGTEITAFCGQEIFFADNFVTRGFQSSVQPQITIGLGGRSRVDSLLVHWPDNTYTVMYSVPANRKLVIGREDSEVFGENPFEKPDSRKSPQLTRINQAVFKHTGSGLVDFNRDRLLPMMYSNETPSLMKGDIDGDGIDEVYSGGGKGQAGSFISISHGKISAHTSPVLRQHSLPEETRGMLADVDNDGDLDLYMASGGRFFPNTSSALMDKIFLNDGAGGFTESPHPLPFKEFVSTSVVKAIDFDRDGDPDIVAGERFDPFVYGKEGRGYLFENDGHGVFSDVTGTYAPDLQRPGMITDIEVQDIDQDGWSDIIVVGDWMPVVILKNKNKSFSPVNEAFGLEGTEGWWHDIESADLNKDGKPDFIIGNHGLNSFFRVDDRMYVSDFDRNGSVEQIFATRVGDKYFPVSDKDELVAQLPSLKKALLYYRDYGKMSIDEIFPKNVLQNSKVFQVKLLSSIVLLSSGEDYVRRDLPAEAQYAPVYSLLVADLDNDGVDDLLAGGNHYRVKPQFGRSDASHCWFFKGVLSGTDFNFQPGRDLGVRGEIRDMELVMADNIKYLFFAKFDDELEIYKLPD